MPVFLKTKAFQRDQKWQESQKRVKEEPAKPSPPPHTPDMQENELTDSEAREHAHRKIKSMNTSVERHQSEGKKLPQKERNPKGRLELQKSRGGSEQRRAEEEGKNFAKVSLSPRETREEKRARRKRYGRCNN